MNDNTVRLHDFIYAYVDGEGFGCFSWEHRAYTTEYIRADVAQAQLDTANARIAELEAAVRLANKTIDIMDEALGKNEARIAELEASCIGYRHVAETMSDYANERDARIVELEATPNNAVGFFRTPHGEWLYGDESTPLDERIQMMAFEMDARIAELEAELDATPAAARNSRKEGMMSDQPHNQIWLQWYEYDDSEWAGVTWCVDQQNDSDVEYVRSDVAAAQLAERDAKLDAIRSVVRRWIDSKDRNLDNGGSMIKILKILYPPPDSKP